MDIIYQVEHEIIYSILPSLLHNSQNSRQERSGKVLYLTVCKGAKSEIEIVGVSELSVECNLEGLYLSDLDSEYRT